METRESKNEFGTTISTHICDTCGERFTVCPSATGKEGWENCLAEECASYDIKRDADRLFEQGDKRIEKMSIC